MPSPSFEGVFIPVTTPFRGGDVVPERLAANLRRWNATALAGYIVLGSTGEFPMLSEAERDRVLVTAREAIPRDKLFLAGTGANSTLHTIRQTKRAAEIGADAAIVITPHYFTKGFSPAPAQVRHYLAVADASPIPVLVYNFPVNTGINLEADTVAKIAQHPNIVGIKDSSGNIPQAAQIIDQTPKTFHVLVGAAAALLPGLAIGAAGGILALAVISAREWCDVYALAKAGRWDEAREIAARMMSADRGIPGRYGIGGLKAALDLQGFYGGPCRAPLGTPDGDAIEDIKEVLATAGLV
ncbi:MAG: dihydrodipicolinate synthase family protein [Candidatus Rokubacteria bacterium]|nr:dihydrodipicolinate synthase family protein [Candidatus Rokubacteria bacterium]